MDNYFSFGTNDWKTVEIPEDINQKIYQLLLKNNNTYNSQIDQLIKENLLLRQSIEKLIIALKASTVSS